MFATGGLHAVSLCCIQADSLPQLHNATNDLPHFPSFLTSQPIPSEMSSRDPIIDRWYQDPYDRLYPLGPTHPQERRQNLDDALRRQGFSKSNRGRLRTWLLKCNGHYKKFDQKSWKYTRRKAREERAKRRGDEARTKREARKAISTNEQADRKEQPEQTAQSDETDEAIDDGDEDTSEDEDDTDANNEETDKLLDNHSSDKITNQWCAANEHERIATLKDCLRTWDIISPTLSQTTANIKFDYCRLVPRRTNRPPMQELLELHDKENSGVLVRTDELTLEQQKMEKARAARLATSVLEHRRELWRLEAHSDSVNCFNHGYRETWKEIRMKRAAVDSNNDAGTGSDGQTCETLLS